MSDYLFELLQEEQMKEDFGKISKREGSKKDTSPWFMDIPPKKNGLARFP